MKTIMKFWSDVVGMADADCYADWYYEYGSRPTWWRTRWSTFKNYTLAILTVIRYQVGKLVCDRFGHSAKMEMEDFVSGERDERGRWIDIDGGGVDWSCPRCGQDGRSWF